MDQLFSSTTYFSLWVIAFLSAIIGLLFRREKFSLIIIALTFLGGAITYKFIDIPIQQLEWSPFVKWSFDNYHMTRSTFYCFFCGGLAYTTIMHFWEWQTRGSKGNLFSTFMFLGLLSIIMYYLVYGILSPDLILLSILLAIGINLLFPVQFGEKIQQKDEIVPKQAFLDKNATQIEQLAKDHKEGKIDEIEFEFYTAAIFFEANIFDDARLYFDSMIDSLNDKKTLEDREQQFWTLAHSKRASINLSEGKKEEAIADYQQALKYTQDRSKYLNRISEIESQTVSNYEANSFVSSLLIVCFFLLAVVIGISILSIYSSEQRMQVLSIYPSPVDYQDYQNYLDQFKLEKSEYNDIFTFTLYDQSVSERHYLGVIYGNEQFLIKNESDYPIRISCPTPITLSSYKNEGLSYYCRIITNENVYLEYRDDKGYFNKISLDDLIVKRNNEDWIKGFNIKSRAEQMKEDIEEDMIGAVRKYGVEKVLDAALRDIQD